MIHDSLTYTCDQNRGWDSDEVRILPQESVFRKTVPAVVRDYVLTLFAFLSLLSLTIFALTYLGEKAAAVGAVFLLVLLFVAAWHGYGLGLLVLALIAYVAPRFISTGPPKPVQLFNFALLALSMLLFSLLGARKRRTEATLREAAERLEQRVTERTKELQQNQERLRHAQRLESIGILAGGVAHDFNNLLGVILGNIELALCGLAEDHPVRSDLSEATDAARKAVAVTRQLLAFSRKQVRKPQALSLREVTLEMENMLRRLIGEHIDFSIRVDAPDLGVIMADRGQIEQVIMNLAVNARDAMLDGGHLKISLSNIELDESFIESLPETKPGHYVLMVVADSGSGMDAATKERIFEPFFTTKPEGRGTGLGLATVYGIVKQSGGNIWVYSELGVGTTFKIYLPRIQAEVARVRPTPQVAYGGSETVLVVEDTEALRKLTRVFLESAGYRVLTAPNGQIAMQVVHDHDGPIHLLVTDVVMPGMNGTRLAAQLQQIHSETRVLYMSGYTDDAISHYGVLAEGVSLLEKPFSRVSLLIKVREVLAQAMSTAA